MWAMNSYSDNYERDGGLLSLGLLRFLRLGVAASVLALAFAPTLALSLAIAPLAPCLLVPTCASPRDKLPKIVAGVGAPCAGLTALLLLGFLSPLTWGLACLCALALTLLTAIWLCNPPVSNCAFCAPFWVLAFSLPLALTVGMQRARESAMAFAAVPDLPLQLPMILVLVVLGVVD